MGRIVIAAVTGALFAAGLAFAGMTKPEKVIAFLDFSGDWDPSLAFVMGGAIALFAPLFHWFKRRERVAFGQALQLPTATHIDPKLVVGSAMFGVGWGIGGFCPGPALAAAGTGALDAVLFAAAMAAGMGLTPLVARTFFQASADKMPAAAAAGREADGDASA